MFGHSPGGGRLSQSGGPLGPTVQLLCNLSVGLVGDTFASAIVDGGGRV
jgi:eukaryotic-like serine/threonine-protein kinase